MIRVMGIDMYTSQQKETPMPLSPYRVLDLTQTHGTLCAQILGDLGADVIQIEPPGGAPGRALGPFSHATSSQDQPESERSLYWWGYSRGKRSIELDIDAQRDTFEQLLAHADFLIEAEPVGALQERPTAYSGLNYTIRYLWSKGGLASLRSHARRGVWAVGVNWRRRSPTGPRQCASGVESCGG